MHYHYFTLEQRTVLENAIRSHLVGAALESALGRLRSADYGVCDACGGDIAFRMLQAHPLARHCPNCS